MKLNLTSLVFTKMPTCVPSTPSVLTNGSRFQVGTDSVLLWKLDTLSVCLGTYWKKEEVKVRESTRWWILVGNTEEDDPEWISLSRF